MQRFLFVITHAQDNATKAIIPLEMAEVAAKSGHEVSVALLGEGVFILQKQIRDSLQGVGTAAASDMIESLTSLEVPIYACGTCMKHRGLDESIFEGTSGRHMNKDIFIELNVEADKVLTF